MTYSEGYRQTGAATLRRRARRDPLAVMHELRTENPQRSKNWIIAAWKDRIAADPDLQDAVNDYAAANCWSQLESSDKQKSPAPKTGEQIAEERERIARVVGDAAKKLTLLELVMPNGKKLRNCTFKECGEFGSWFKILATKGRPSEKVGDKFKTDEELAALK